MQTANAIDRLAQALTDYRESKPSPWEQRKLLAELATRYGIGIKTMTSAVLIMSGVDVTPKEKKCT